MATRYWLGRSLRRAQVVTFSITAADTSTSYRVTIGVNTVSVSGLATVDLTAAALQAALSASDAGEFREISWSVSTSTITGTANIPGKPFTAVTSVSGGAGTIGAVTTTTTNSSPNDLTDANNWSAATLPVSGDSIVFENSPEGVFWNLDGFAAKDIVSCVVRDTMTGAIGLPTYSADGGYYEYRPTELEMQTCTTLTVEQSPQLGAEGQKFNVATNPCTATFNGQGGGSIGAEIAWFRGTNTTNVVNANGASLAIGALISHVVDLATLRMTTGSVVRVGRGVEIIETLSTTDSTLDIDNAGITTLTTDGDGSSVTIRGTTAIATANLYGGTVTYNSNGTIGTLTLGSQTRGGSIDFTQDRRPMTITNLVNAYVGSQFNDKDTRVTLSAGIKIPNGRLSDIQADFGVGRTYTIA